jgi:hypothetical protein
MADNHDIVEELRTAADAMMAIDDVMFKAREELVELRDLVKKLTNDIARLSQEIRDASSPH